MKHTHMIIGNPSFMANLIWKSRQNVDSRAKNNISNDHEFILAYGVRFRGADKDLEKYSNPDVDVRGPWMSDNMVGLATRAARPNLHYQILVDRIEGLALMQGQANFDLSGHQLCIPCAKIVGPLPVNGDLVAMCVSLEMDRPLSLSVIPKPLDHRTVVTSLYRCPDKGWRYEPESMAKRIVDNRILWPESGDGRPRKKTFQQELKSDFTGFSSVVGFTSDGTKDLSAMFGSGVPVSFPKPNTV